MANVMTSRDRILCALGGGKPDRVPLTISRNLLDDNTWFARDPSYREMLSIARSKTDILYKKEDYGTMSYRYDCPRFDPEIPVQISSKPMGVTEIIMDTPRGKLKRVKKSVPGTTLRPNVENFIKEKEDVTKLLSIPYRPALDDEGFKEEERNLGERGVVLLAMWDPVGAVCDLCEPTQFAIWSMDEKAMIRDMIDLMYERIEYELRSALETARKSRLMSVFYFAGPEYVIPPLQPPKFFEDFVTPYDSKLFELVHSFGYMGVIHCHGKIDTFLERFIDMGADAVHPAEPPPSGDVVLRDIRSRLGNNICIIGNIEYDDLSNCCEEEIDKKIRDVITFGGAEGAFILSPCCGLFETPIPVKTATNYIRFIEAGFKYGQSFAG
jgi:hypothetical protein